MFKWAITCHNLGGSEWGPMLFIDEHQSQRFGNKRRQFAPRLFGQPLKSQGAPPTVKHKGSLAMIW